jgi:hypothetical protein
VKRGAICLPLTILSACKGILIIISMRICIFSKLKMLVAICFAAISGLKMKMLSGLKLYS